MIGFNVSLKFVSCKKKKFGVIYICLLVIYLKNVLIHVNVKVASDCLTCWKLRKIQGKN